MNKYLNFVQIPFKGKTKKFYVISKSSEITLGEIKWYSQWRQYIFEPSPETIWNRDCLNDIIFFINDLMQDRKVKLLETKKDISNIKPLDCTGIDINSNKGKIS